MKKKLLALLLMACVAMSAAACGSTEEKPAEDQTTENTADTETEEDTADAETEEDTEMDMSALGTSTLVELGEYKNVTYTPVDTTVSEDMVEQQVQSVLASAEELVEVTDHDTVTTEDVANIDYEGKKDGVAFDGGTAQGYDLDIDNSGFIDGFAEGVEGMKVGETKDLNLTFPDSYHAEELAGQEVVFTVTVNYISQYQTPELNDDFAVDQGYESLDDMYVQVEAELIAEAEYNATNSKLTEVVQKIIDASTFEITEEETDLYTQDLIAQQENAIAMYGMDLESYVGMYGMTMEQFEESMREQGVYRIKLWLVEKAIADAEGITMTQEEYDSFVETYAAYYGYEDVTQFEEEYGAGNIEKQIIGEKVLEYLNENAVAGE